MSECTFCCRSAKDVEDVTRKEKKEIKERHEVKKKKKIVVNDVRPSEKTIRHVVKSVSSKSNGSLRYRHHHWTTTANTCNYAFLYKVSHRVKKMPERKKVKLSKFYSEVCAMTRAKA